MNADWESLDQYPFHLEDVFGTVTAWEQLCPGVYYLCARSPGKVALPQEYYVVERSAPAISDRAKEYGRDIPGHAGLLSYWISRAGSGWQVVEYEIRRYQLRFDRSQTAVRELDVLAFFGKETNPDYFGCFIAPEVTPSGITLDSTRLDNGIFWVTTSKGSQMLAVSYPIWQGDLSEDTSMRLGKQNLYDRRYGIHRTMGPLFFDARASCIPLYELLPWHWEWKTSGQIDCPALMNAVWRFDPRYALKSNLRALGEPGELERKLAQGALIAYTPGAGTDFLHL